MSRSRKSISLVREDSSTNREYQAGDAKIAFAERLRSKIDALGLSSAKVAQRAGISSSAMSRYMNGQSFPSSEQLFPLCDELGVEPRWLISGVKETNFAVVDAEAADWVDVEERDLRELTDVDRGPIVSTTPFRKDWLNRTLGQASGLWLARLPADLPRFDLREGDLVFLRDVRPGEAQDGAIYIVRVWGRLTVVQLDALQDAQRASTESNVADRRLAFRNIGTEDGKALLVARVLGAPLKRL